mmetsp:Transcript_31424/g.49075  ORF Transcript_31424/g.49075 Transcript_31424/m.49075 type:complete len:328 (-) Transcript_31424:43-1026(-)
MAEDPKFTFFITGGSGFVGRHLIRFLVGKNHHVKALVRSENSAQVVKKEGAEPVLGELSSNLDEKMAGSQHVIHLAGKSALEGSVEEFFRVNVDGAVHVMNEAIKSGAQTFTHISTGNVLLGSPHLINCDETWEYPAQAIGPYAQSKLEAEKQILAKASEDPQTKIMIIRPRLIWGPGDTSALPQMCDAMATKRWVWIGGGNHQFTTVHVSNLVYGIWCAVQRGKNNNVYYFTDGENVHQKEFLGRLVGTKGVDASQCWSIPSWLGFSLAYCRLVPPQFAHMFGQTFTATDAKARSELGYKNVITIEEGFKELEEEAKGQAEKKETE